jgi:hypothetical protein
MNLMFWNKPKSAPPSAPCTKCEGWKETASTINKVATAEIADLKTQVDTLSRRLVNATARALNAENRLKETKPAADKWMAAQTKRRDARKVAK